MSYVSLSKAYNVAPSRRDGARAGPGAVQQTPAVNPDGPSQQDREKERESAEEREAARQRDCDSASRAPLMQALIRALKPPLDADGRVDAELERALIAFARALNQATSGVDAGAQPASERASEAARRRANHEDELLDAFAGLQRASASAESREQLRAQLNRFLREVARQLNIDDDRTWEATQPGSLISVQA